MFLNQFYFGDDFKSIKVEDGGEDESINR